MDVIIEHSFCLYCDEATEIYFRIMNTILFSGNEAELRAGMEHLKEETQLVRIWRTSYLDKPATTERQKQTVQASCYDGTILTF